MKKRFVSMFLGIAIIFAITTVSSVAFADPAPHYLACLSCGGRIGTVKEATGYSKPTGYDQVCSLDKRYNCPMYNVQYHDVEKCLECGRVYSEGQPYMVPEQRHWH